MIDYTNIIDANPKLGPFRYISIIVSVMLAEFVPSIWNINRYGEVIVLAVLLFVLIALQEWCKYEFRKAGLSKSLAGVFARGELFPYMVFGGLYVLIYNMLNLGSILR